ncbi:MAG: arsenate reductase ArsC [Chloroflexi bacterium]|nr:arsenate reductase ArsC [Chloroflexota bacterium]
MTTTTRSRERVIFLCTHNSARSQMAEGLLRSVAGDRFEVVSAGTVATTVRPEAVAVMREIGVDIGSQTSKTLEPFIGEPFDWLITVCDQAREACPTMPGVERQLHWSVDDPSAVDGDDEARLEAFRSARDELGGRVAAFLADDAAAP